MRTRFVAALVALLTLMVVVAPVATADATTGMDVLIDDGDGTVEWSQGNGTTVVETILSVAEDADREIGYDGVSISVDGVSTMTIGSSSSGGSLIESGTTGTQVVTSWRTYGWSEGTWVEVTPESDSSSYSAVALGFYPLGVIPVVTPDEQDAWTMFRGDSKNSGGQDATFSSTSDYTISWYDEGGAFANPLYAGGYVFQKYGVHIGGSSDGYATLACIDVETGERVWEFEFISGMNYENSTPLIVGDSIYVATMTGHIYKMPWKVGPGENNENVMAIGNVPMSDAVSVPSLIKDFDVGMEYGAGFTSLIYDSGAIYATHNNGMAYCFDLDLNLIWSSQMNASSYFIAPTIVDGYVFTGALDGHLYVMDKATGSIILDRLIFQTEVQGRMYGGLGQIAVIRTDSTYSLIFTITDGLGMSEKNSGIGAYEYDPVSNVLVERYKGMDIGTFGRYVSPVQIPGFTGAYATVMTGGDQASLIRISTDGKIETIVEGLAEIHSAGVVVNDEWIYLTSYASADPIYRISLLKGEIDGVAYCSPDVKNFNMSCPIILGDTIIGVTDSGIYRIDGSFLDYVEPSSDKGAPVILYLGAMVALVLVILAIVWVIIRFVKHEEKPFGYLKGCVVRYLYGDHLSHNTRNKHRLKFVLFIGAILIFVTFTLCICIGSTSVMNPIDAYSALFSAISKGGVGLDMTETTVFVSRLPRTIAALAVGIGLAIAGSVYQAIIRNPLVDPYIMGVSSGAGIAAIAVIAFDFTFFGLFSSHSIFLTAISAIIGGLVAFACTMVIAEKAGGSSINYVLAGVVVGLAFSALQTIMLTMAGNKLSNALSWLYGSFAEVTWAQVGVILFLSVFLSLVPMFWAKEFNLVLLGEDQAREMGLNVRMFNRCMLVLASVLTSVCVAFCGVIGFVGLVIPHLCRMLLGSDHRMVLPASFCFGAVMLMLADLLARTGYYGMELPVGAITTIIGIPVFAYLLIRKGRMYDG